MTVKMKKAELKAATMGILEVKDVRSVVRWAKTQGLTVDLCYKEHWELVFNKARTVKPLFRREGDLSQFRYGSVEFRFGHYQLDKKTGETKYFNHVSFPAQDLVKAKESFELSAKNGSYFGETEDVKAIKQVFVLAKEGEDLVILKEYFISEETHKCVIK